MSDTNALKRLGFTPAKIALVVFLAIVLLVVIVVQWPSGPGAPPVTQAAQAAANSPTGDATNGDAPARPDATTASVASLDDAMNGPVGDATDDSHRRAWPAIDPDQAKRHNPFILPNHWRSPTASDGDKSPNPDDPESRQILRELSQAEGGIVMTNGNVTIARIGATTLRLGDKIGRYRVSKIDATGVWLVDE